MLSVAVSQAVNLAPVVVMAEANLRRQYPAASSKGSHSRLRKYQAPTAFSIRAKPVTTVKILDTIRTSVLNYNGGRKGHLRVGPRAVIIQLR